MRKKYKMHCNLNHNLELVLLKINECLKKFKIEFSNLTITIEILIKILIWNLKQLKFRNELIKTMQN